MFEFEPICKRLLLRNARNIFTVMLLFLIFSDISMASTSDIFFVYDKSTGNGVCINADSGSLVELRDISSGSVITPPYFFEVVQLNLPLHIFDNFSWIPPSNYNFDGSYSNIAHYPVASEIDEKLSGWVQIDSICKQQTETITRSGSVNYLTQLSQAE